MHVDESQIGKCGENKNIMYYTVIRSREHSLWQMVSSLSQVRNSRITSFSWNLIPINGSWAIHSLVYARLVISFRYFI